MTAQPVALTVAGSDSGGGPGIQADLTTMACLGVHGTSVLTVVTAQNTVGVQGLHPLPEHVVEDQLASLLADLPPSAVSAACSVRPAWSPRWPTRWRGGAGARGALPRPVVDPVLVATSGDRLTSGDADRVVSPYVETLLPRSALVTPNTDEAAALPGGGAAYLAHGHDPSHLRPAGPDARARTSRSRADLGPRRGTRTGSAHPPPCPRPPTGGG